MEENQIPQSVFNFTDEAVEYMKKQYSDLKLFSDSSSELPLIPFSKLKDKVFVIPYQQRGYKWTSANVEELLFDLKDFIEDKNGKKRIYCLQPLAVVEDGENRYCVLDGQQRLTTLYLLNIYLYGKAPYSILYDRDTQGRGAMSRTDFLDKVASPSITEEQASENIDFYYIYNAYKHIAAVFKKWAQQSIGKDDKDAIQERIGMFIEAFKELLEAGQDEKSLQVIWYMVNKNKQHETFRNLNSGKIHLTNTELIKALMLNRVSGLPPKEREEAAAIFEQIEQYMQNDQFWYMFNAGELREGQARMDFLFNLVAGCKQNDYEIDARWSFRNYFSNPEKGSLSEKWKQVRHTFLRLKDMYDDIYCYHYIGFLTYNSNTNTLYSTRKLLKLSRESTHSDFVKNLKKDIKTILTQKHCNVRDYTYYSDKKDLRLLFIMHNIESILQKYNTLRNNEQLNLITGFERFPFELLHKQKWDIEHIASNTDSDFKNPEDRESWLKSIKADLGGIYSSDQKIMSLEERYIKTKKKEDFDNLYKAIMCMCEKDIADAIKDTAEDGKDKMQVGNITLLDSHTNRSYHNALFPRKRRYIIVANGLIDKTDDFEENISKVYIPPCTLSVFTKAYNKDGNLSFNAWTQTDADAYTKDIEQKLSYYYTID